MAGPLTNLLTGLTGRLHRAHPLSPEEQEKVMALPHVVHSFEPGAYIIREGERARSSSVVLKGLAYRHKLVADGGRQIVSIHMATDLVDLQSVLLDYSDHNVQALTRVELAMMDREAVLDLAFREPSIGRALWRGTLIEASILREWIVNVGRRDARSRTAHVLCEIAVRQEALGFGSRDKFELPMTQEQLGDVLGLTPVHVNRTLKSLQDDGVINRSKRSVTIADWNHLSSVADFTTGYLHLDEMPNPVESFG